LDALLSKVCMMDVVSCMTCVRERKWRIETTMRICNFRSQRRPQDGEVERLTRRMTTPDTVKTINTLLTSQMSVCKRLFSELSPARPGARLMMEKVEGS